MNNAGPLPRAFPGHFNPGDVNNDRVMSRPAFYLENAFYRMGVKSVGSQPINGLRRHGHYPPSTQQVSRCFDGFLKKRRRVGRQHGCRALILALRHGDPIRT